MRRQHLAFLKTLCERKLQRALAHEKYVIGLLHHPSRHRCGRGNTLQSRHCAIPERAPIDHRRIDFDLARGIGITAVPNAPNPRIALDHFNPLNDRVERGTTAFQNVPCGLIGSEAKSPGGNDYWGHCGLSVLSQFV